MTMELTDAQNMILHMAENPPADADPMLVAIATVLVRNGLLGAQMKTVSLDILTTGDADA